MVTSKEDQIKLEPSVATGCVDGSTPMVWYDDDTHTELTLYFPSCGRSLLGYRPVSHLLTNVDAVNAASPLRAPEVLRGIFLVYTCRI